MRKAASLSEKLPDGCRNPTKSLLPLLIGGAKAGNKLLLSDVSFVYSAAVSACLAEETNTQRRETLGGKKNRNSSKRFFCKNIQDFDIYKLCRFFRNSASLRLRGVGGSNTEATYLFKIPPLVPLVFK